ncbi:hypothetical protein OG21DRAFT_369595 [Imleria badia]|nr:hypothetical protein OG21DRAFT_369595 [Imleria badia]
MAVSSRTSFDNARKTYNVNRVINADALFNLSAYEEYSPLFLSTTFPMSYGPSFASITATLTHSFLCFRKQIWTQSRRSMREQVPEWWYGVIFVAMFVFGIIVIKVWHTEFLVWAFCLSLSIAFLYVIPIGMIQAITNQQVGLNVITKLIVGYALPGRPIAMMMFKTWGYITMTHALGFASDFKLGHYTNIPPRSMFWGTSHRIPHNLRIGLPTSIKLKSLPYTPGRFNLAYKLGCSRIFPTCVARHKRMHSFPNTEVFATGSIVWGVIGPMRMFSSGQIYSALTYWFLIGAVCPLIAYMVHLKWPDSFIRYVNFPVIFSGPGAIAYASGLNYVAWAIVSFIFQYHIRRRHFSWWIKYNYVLSAALDTGLACAVILIFFILQYPKNWTIGLTTVQGGGVILCLRRRRKEFAL